MTKNQVVEMSQNSRGGGGVVWESGEVEVVSVTSEEWL